jgi:hypothetical protein
MNNAINFDHVTFIDGNEAAERLKGVLKAAGVKMLITGARVSAIFPDGSVARYQELHMDTEQ